MTRFPDTMTLAEARGLLRTLVEEGQQCPCCNQFAKIYRRTIHSTMARELIAFYRHAGRDWGCLKDSGVQRGGDMVKVRYWNLIEPDLGVREDGSPRNGWWRVTARGEAWLLGRVAVPKHALIYAGVCRGLDGAPITVRDALGEKFNYAALMGHDLLVESQRITASPEPVTPPPAPADTDPDAANEERATPAGSTLFSVERTFDELVPPVDSRPSNAIFGDAS